MFVGLKFLFSFNFFKTTDGLYLSLCVVDPTVAGGLCDDKLPAARHEQLC